MEIKDVIKVTLFAVIGFILSIVSGMAVSAMGSFGMFVHAALGSFLIGPVFVTMVRRIRKRGVIFIFYAVNGLIYLLMGMWPMTPILLVGGLLGELLLGRSENCDCNWRLGSAYVFSELVYAMHGLILVLVLGVEGMVKQFPTMFTQESAQAARDLYMNARNLCLIVGIQLLGSILGAFFGFYIYNKFFAAKARKESVL